TRSSGTSWPLRMYGSAMRPIGLFSRMASRKMSPVPICTRCSRLHSSFAWVPLPLPGGPTRINRMAQSARRTRKAEAAPPSPTGRSLFHFREQPSKPQGAAEEESANRKPARSALGQARVVAHDQVAVDLLHQVQCHAHNDEEAGAAVE